MPANQTVKIHGREYGYTFDEKIFHHYESGRPRYIHVDAVIPIRIGKNNFKIDGNAGLVLFENGDLSSCELFEEAEIQIGSNTIPLKKGDAIYFSEMGRIKFIGPKENIALKVGDNTIEFRGGGGEIHFHANGNIKKGVLAGPQRLTVKNTPIVFRPYGSFHGDIWFHENEMIDNGLLGEDVSIDIEGETITYSKDTGIGFTKEGQVRKRNPSNKAL